MFVTECEYKNLSPLTVKTYKTDIGYLIEFLEGIGVTDIEKLTLTHLKRWVVEMQKRPLYAGMHRENPEVTLSPYTVNKRIRSVKSFLAWVYSEEYITKDLSSQFKKIKQPNKIIPTFDFDVIKDWLEVFDLETFTGHRNYVIMCTLLDCGLRISELTNLKACDINMKEGYFLVTGKGSKQRVVPFSHELRKKLTKYLRVFEKKGFDMKEGYLFPSTANEGQRLSPITVGHTITITGRKIGLTGDKISPHTFRHTFAKNYVINGGDVFSLQKILGHTSLAMVRHYTNLDNADIINAHRKASPLARLR
jgi:integrase/recombinase XerD